MRGRHDRVSCARSLARAASPPRPAGGCWPRWPSRSTPTSSPLPAVRARRVVASKQGELDSVRHDVALFSVDRGRAPDRARRAVRPGCAAHGLARAAALAYRLVAAPMLNRHGPPPRRHYRARGVNFQEGSMESAWAGPGRVGDVAFAELRLAAAAREAAARARARAGRAPRTPPSRRRPQGRNVHDPGQLRFGVADPAQNYTLQEWQLLIDTHDGLVGFARSAACRARRSCPTWPPPSPRRPTAARPTFPRSARGSSSPTARRSSRATSSGRSSGSSPCPARPRSTRASSARTSAAPRAATCPRAWSPTTRPTR